MVTIKIDTKKSFLPLKIAKGTVKERLENARQMNDAFHEILKKDFVESEMSRFRFSKLLQKSAGNKIPVTYYDEWSKTGDIRHLVNENATCKGYFLIFPKNAYSDKVKKTDMKELLKMTQKYFNDIWNPKFFRRVISMFNKGENPLDAEQFFEKEINIIGGINKKKLSQYLKGLSLEEKIDTLQLFRYSLQKAENINQFNKEYMRKINRTPHTDVKYSERAIEANPYQYTEKLEFIEAELLKALQKARTKK